MASSDAHHDLEAGPSTSHEPITRSVSENTPISSDLTNNMNAPASRSIDLSRLIRALSYVVQLILIQLREAPNAVIRHIQHALPFARHTNDALLPQFTQPVTSGSDPPALSSDSFRDAVISSFISNSSSVVPEHATTERTPLLGSSNLHPNDLSASSRRALHLKIRVTGSDSPDVGVCGEPLSNNLASGAVSDHHPHHHIMSASSESDASNSTNPGLDDSTPSASSLSSDSSPSCSTPSSSNSSFVMLRSALKTPSPSMSAHPSPRLGPLRLGFGGETIDGLVTGRSSPVPKSVRFNPEGNETHFFEYAPHEEHETKSLKSPSSSMGRWKKNGGTIVWQDGPERPRNSNSSHTSTAHDAESEEEAYSRALFGRSLPGRILYSLLLGSRPPSFVPTSSSSSAASGSALAGEGRRNGGASLGWADEGRWRDGMF